MVGFRSDDSHLKETKKAKKKETWKKGTMVQSDAKTPKQPHATAAPLAMDFSHKSRTYFLVKPGNWMDSQVTINLLSAYIALSKSERCMVAD